MNILSFLFFFQAEDGIRDGHVTGVQTCALPISAATHPVAPDALRLAPPLILTDEQAHSFTAEIGRASCRERGQSPVGDVYMKKIVIGEESEEEGKKTKLGKCESKTMNL